MIQTMNELSRTVSKLEERTENVRREIVEMRQDLKGLPSRASYWMGIGLAITIFLAIAAMFGTMIVVPMGDAIREGAQILRDTRHVHEQAPPTSAPKR